MWAIERGSSGGPADPTGDLKSPMAELDFDRRLMLRCRGSSITSDAGLPSYRALSLTDMGP